jgi:hypothetical protein
MTRFNKAKKIVEMRALAAARPPEFRYPSGKLLASSRISGLTLKQEF